MSFDICYRTFYICVVLFEKLLPCALRIFHKIKVIKDQRLFIAGGPRYNSYIKHDHLAIELMYAANIIILCIPGCTLATLAQGVEVNNK